MSMRPRPTYLSARASMASSRASQETLLPSSRVPETDAMSRLKAAITGAQAIEDDTAASQRGDEEYFHRRPLGAANRPVQASFYESESGGESAASIANKAKDGALEMQTLSLPEPAVSFSPSPTYLPLMGGMDLFAPMGGGEGRIVGANVAGESMLYDADERLFLHLPWINEPKGWDPVCLSIPIPGAAENSLYVMERHLGEAMDAYGSSEDYKVSCFEVLEHGPRTGGPEVREMHRGWRWRVLRPPPFVLEPDYQPSHVASYTSLVNKTNRCSTIYMSCDDPRIGTYCFDTSRNVEEIRMEARSHKHLCALDLSGMEEDKQQPPPILQHFEDLNPPKEEDWCATSSELVYLGDGKFCVAKSIETDEIMGEQFAVLTGIQILRNHANNGLLRMIKHKSTCYHFVKDTINWVL
ncbi:hypothetical protein ZWY2020_002597 [Hordeum vulgare]|nr:hypothetical protein ZWY2020_002597 [Hordeum vulgare]